MNDTIVPIVTGPVCNVSTWFVNFGDQLRFSYRIIIPLYFTLCISGHGFCLWAFAKQSASEKAYVYQIYLTIGDLLDVIFFAALLLTFLWGGVAQEGHPWFQAIYPFMFYTAHMAVPLNHGTGMVTLLLSISLVCDRILALKKPFVYKDMAHKKRRRIALACSYLIGMSSTVYNCLLYRIDPSNSTVYAIKVDVVYAGSIVGSGSAYVCNAIRVIGLLILIGCNVGLVILYPRHAVQSIAINKKSQADPNRQAERKATEKDLFVLALSESVFTGVKKLSSVVFYFTTYIIPTFTSCEARTYGPALNILLMFTYMGDTCATVFFNKKTRKTIQKMALRMKNLFRNYFHN